MANKENRFLMILSTVVVFLVVAVLYIAPSVKIYTEMGSSSVVENPVTEEKKIVAPLPVKGSPANANEEKSTESPVASEPIIEEKMDEEKQELYIHKDILINDIHFALDAFDGYGSIRFPKSIDEKTVEECISNLAPNLDNAQDFSYSIEQGSITVFYNQGYSENDINKIINTVTSTLDSMEIIVPAKPNLYVSSQGLVPEKREYTRTMICGGYAFDISSTVDGEAIISIPDGVTHDDISTALSLLKDEFSIDDGIISYAFSDDSLTLSYPKAFTSSQLDFFIDMIEVAVNNYLNKEVEAKVEAEVPVEVAKPVEKINVNESFMLQRDIPLLGMNVKATAEDGNITITLPVYLEEDLLADYIVSLIENDYNTFKSFDFAIEGNTIYAYSADALTIEDYSNALDSISDLLTSIKPAVPKKVPTLSASSDLITKEIGFSDSINIYGLEIPVNAKKDSLEFVLPVKVDQERVADYIVSLCGYNALDLSDFDFALDDDAIFAYFSEIDEDTLRMYIDGIESFFSLAPEAPSINTSLELIGDETESEPPLDNSTKSIEIIGGYINAKIDDNSICVEFPSSVDEDTIASHLVSFLTSTYPLFSDYDFALEKNSLQLISTEEINKDLFDSFFDAIISYISYIPAPIEEIEVPSEPMIVVAEESASNAIVNIEPEPVLKLPVEKERRFSVGVYASPFSTYMGFFYNFPGYTFDNFTTIKGWGVQGELGYKLNRALILSIQSGYSEHYFDGNIKIWQVPVAAILDLYKEFGSKKQFLVMFGLGGGLMISSDTVDIDYDLMAQAELGFGLRLSSTASLEMKSIWRAVFDCWNTESMMNNIALTSNNYIGLKLAF